MSVVPGNNNEVPELSKVGGDSSKGGCRLAGGGEVQSDAVSPEFSEAWQ